MNRGIKMRVGIYGIGNISEKAYMPVMINNREKIEWVLTSRSQERLTSLLQKYGFDEGYTNLDELIASGIEACFVHSPTHTHYQVIKELLLAGVHVFVDKPVSDNEEETQELFRLAQERNQLLFVGYNRRYAPFIFEESNGGKENKHIYSYKHRVNSPQPIRFVIYDLFLHPLDTAIYMAGNQEIRLSHIEYRMEKELLSYVSVHLLGENTTMHVGMNLVSGANREGIELHKNNETIVIENLDKKTLYSDGVQQIKTFNDWDSTLYKRGFEPMIQSFLMSIVEGELPETQVKTKLSHEICEQIVSYIEKNK